MIETVIETLAYPAAWTKGAFARTEKGRVIGPECQNAACFCLLGALIHTDPNFHPQSLGFVLAAIRELFPTRIAHDSIDTFNDHPDTTHEDVLRVLHRARELELTADAVEVSFSGAPMPPDGIEGCVACGVPFKAGDMVLSEESGGEMHVECCGPERDSYVGPGGEPLKDGEPIPTGRPWEPSPSSPAVAVE